MSIELLKIYFTIFVIGIILYSIRSFKKIKIDNGLYKSKIDKVKVFGLFTFLIASVGLMINIYFSFLDYKAGLIVLTLGIGFLVGLSLITILITIQYILIDKSKTILIDFNNQMIKSIDKNDKTDNFRKIKKIEIHESRWTGFGNPVDILGYLLIIDEDGQGFIITNASISLDKFSNKFKGIKKTTKKKWIQIINKRTMPNI